jgi:hypothetical protein
VQVALGIVFLAAGVDKCWRIAEFAIVIDYLLPFLPSHPAWPTSLAASVCLLEALIGVCLITGWSARLIAAVAVVTVVAYSLALVRLTLDPIAPRCGCMTWLRSSRSIATDGSFGLIRNAVMLLLPGLIWWESRGTARLERSRGT